MTTTLTLTLEMMVGGRHMLYCWVCQSVSGQTLDRGTVWQQIDLTELLQPPLSPHTTNTQHTNININSAKLTHKREENLLKNIITS